MDAVEFLNYKFLLFLVPFEMYRNNWKRKVYNNEWDRGSADYDSPNYDSPIQMWQYIFFAQNNKSF